MYKSLCNYSATDKTQLNIKVGQTFEFKEVRNEHWWSMRCQENGKVGLVPISYLAKVEQSTNVEEKTSVLESIDRAIDAIYRSSGNSGELDRSQRTKLQKLIEHRRKVFSNYLKEKSPSTNKQSSAMGAAYSTISNIPIQPSRPAPDPPGGARKRKAPEPPIQSNIPSTIGGELVEQIRVSTGLTHAKSIAAVETVLMHLRHRAPAMSKEADYILESLYYSQENSSNVPEKELLSTHDGKSLHALVQELVKCKEDSQQRSWALHEDEAVITKCLKDVVSILHGANPRVCLAVVRQDSYDGLNALVEYYQMETRTSIRHLLLQVFSECCSLGAEVVSQLLCTILPVELARDMQTDIKDLEKLVNSARLCTMIFSTGEAIPYQHYEYLNRNFVEYLVNIVEEPPCGKDDEERVVNAFVPMILSFNQHFEDVKMNTVMQVLSNKRTSKILSEKLMLLVNRGDDPVNIFGYLDRCPDSLLKFFEDIFSSETTSGLFFTNDLMVLIDIVLRQVLDLSPGEELRTEYLSLLHSILTTTNYSEYRHRHDELGKCLSRINEEEGPEVTKDQLIVNEIFNSFSGLL